MSNKFNPWSYLTKLATAFREVCRYFPNRYKPTTTPMSNNNDPLGLVNTDAAAAVPPRSSARESAALDSLLALHNNAAERVVAPPEPVTQPDTLPVAKPLEPVKTFVTTGSARVLAKTPSKLLLFSGRLKAGKDTMAAAAGATVLGLADPLYAMRKYFFGDVPKDANGARSLLQQIGQFGRGTASAQYPLTTARASFVVMCRSLGSRGEFGDWSLDWAAFGLSESLWLDALVLRIEKSQAEHPGVRLAVPNIRFANEHARLTAIGGTHWHVQCSVPTWEARLRAAGLDSKSPELADASEALALSLDQQALQASRKPPARKLFVIWNDEKQAAPSAVFHTPESFVASLA